MSAPDEARDLVALLRGRARETPERTAYTFLAGDGSESTLDFAAFDRRARAIGARLQAADAAGERVLLLFDSGLEFMTAFLGCLYAGSVAVPLHPPRGRAADRYATVAEDARARLVLTTARHLDVARAIGTPGAIDLGTVPDQRAAAWREPRVDGDTTAFLQYTSGSTAAPKGVVVSHGNLLFNTRMMARAFRQNADTLLVSWLPLHHDMGLIGVALQSLSLGAPCVLMPPESFLMEPFRWLEAITRFRAYTSGAPNFAYELCVRKVTEEERAALDLSSWKHAFNGSEPVRGATLRRFAATFGPCGFAPETMYPCYGLAEATLFVAGGLQPDEPATACFDARALEEGRVVPVTEASGTPYRELVSCGTTWCEQELVVADPESGATLPPDRVGEIRLRGPGVAHGYWNALEATARTFPGGWLRTGDLGFVFEGQLYLCGRLKDLIIVGGRNHHPEDLEETVESAHPAIRRGCSAAFGVDEDGEERLVVVAELVPDALGSPAELRALEAAVTRAIASRHGLRPHALTWIEPRTIPKTTSGKVRRGATRTAWLEQTLRRRAA